MVPEVPGCPPGGAPNDVAAVAVSAIVLAASETGVGLWSGLCNQIYRIRLCDLFNLVGDDIMNFVFIKYTC